MAEREGFEPPIPVKVWPLSRRLVSTTHAPLRAVKIRGLKYFIRYATGSRHLQLRLNRASYCCRKASMGSTFIALRAGM